MFSCVTAARMWLRLGHLLALICEMVQCAEATRKHPDALQWQALLWGELLVPAVSQSLL